MPSPGPLAVDLNADVGEAFGAYAMGDDAGLLPFVTSVNVACGFHGGEPLVMDRTVATAVRSGAAIGAHPGYWDLRGFGRRPQHWSAPEIEADIVYQVGALAAFARAHGRGLTHVKPHGALYHQAADDEGLAAALARAVLRSGEGLVLVGPAHSAVLRRAAEGAGLRYAAEAFADRRYAADGRLVPRRVAGAVIEDPNEAAAQAVRIARHGRAPLPGGHEIPVIAETIGLHGDTPGAVAVAQAVRAALEAAGVRVQAFAR